MAGGPNEAADTKLIEELVFKPSGVTLERYGDAEKNQGKTPDFKLVKNGKLCGFCELKSPRDDWTFEFPDDLKPGEVITKTRPDPTSHNLARQIEGAVAQFHAVNSDHQLPNVLAIVNHAPNRTRSDLHVALTGIQAPDGARFFTMKLEKQKRVLEAARRVDLFLWIDAKAGSFLTLSAEDARHGTAARDLLGIKTET